jgi:long-chain acyl-CoA synthetase
MHTAAVGGLPRGALLSHNGLMAAGMQLIAHWRLGPDDVNLGMLPMFHVSGLGLFMAVLQAGGATVLSARFDPAAAVEQIQAHRVTVFAEFAPMLGQILDQAGSRGADLASLRAISGLDTPDTLARFHAHCPGADFWAGYGQTEVSGMATLAPARERPGSAGRPTLLCEVGVVDDADQPLPVGGTGEIVVRGPMVFLGYWQLEEDSRQAARGGWHHTGDMGRFDPDGYLWYAGRSPAKELIKPGGENVYPAEVEKVILEHPAIAEVVVIGVADPQWGEAIKAVCACRPGATAPSPAELIEFVGARIARFKKPKHVVFVDQLPRTNAGLPDRPRVREQHGDKPA